MFPSQFGSAGCWTLGNALALDFEDVQGEEDNLSDSSEAGNASALRPRKRSPFLETYDPAVACINALPFFSPNALVNLLL